MSTQKQAVTGAQNETLVRERSADELVKREKAVFIRSLDGYVMSENDFKNLLREAEHQAVRIIKLEAQRDELLTALKASALELAMRGAFHTESGLPTPLQRDIEAAIARAEGRAE